MKLFVLPCGSYPLHCCSLSFSLSLAHSPSFCVVVVVVVAAACAGTGCGRRSSKAALLDWSLKAGIAADKIQYVAHFTLDAGFGLPAAIAIENQHQNELFIETIALSAGAAAATSAHSGPIVYFPCYSWVQPKYKMTRGSERVFFNNHASLPSQTPAGLRELREQDKAARRGNGKGVRKPWDNIYDYDVYNDVGNPDKHIGLARTILGGSTQHPYPRRCRTGRQSTKTCMPTLSLSLSTVTSSPSSSHYYINPEGMITANSTIFVTRFPLSCGN
jgi:lipoxygenase